ncbi:MAG: hypothetical protein B7Y56_05615 [Gallionellales bacterium 35-53-114]|jgi:hypothetical protein|nr:MAG: hypothetical protein B7Y56_05615 [Gallionellales bacterium 35-53-114]OYZ63686.1 MAG: hypothetical protein B7Y04_06725 [Gallionellales bacterium 24-53-125]OZB09481.1 MAG: hypothetical protein B7X61_07490 [Gallionellales bacterium 39-52-133]
MFAILPAWAKYRVRQFATFSGAGIFYTVRSAKNGCRSRQFVPRKFYVNAQANYFRASLIF